ncbi:hypothetical protein MMC07_008851 [Pseudocyphellaria aurata]|nr:hypothetical protein [Pseudocyphellaria aurata]
MVDALTAFASEKLNSASASLSSAVRLVVADISWDDFAYQWEDAYSRLVDTYDPSTPFVTVSEFHHTSLVQLVKDENLSGLWSPEELRELSQQWHFLHPWLDVPRGFAALAQQFPLYALSNGDKELLSDLTTFGKLHWTRAFSAEDFHAYKPSPLVYNGAAAACQLPTRECALVAAHLGDLKGAKKCGYQTIYVERGFEEHFTPEEVEEAKKEGWVDMWVEAGDGGDEGGFLEVARRFGIEVSDLGLD